MSEAGPGRWFCCRLAFRIDALGITELLGTIVGGSSVVPFVLALGESLGVRGGEMGSTPEGLPGIADSSSDLWRGDGLGLLELLPGGGRIKESSSSWEKLFSRYSFP